MKTEKDNLYEAVKIIVNDFKSSKIILKEFAVTDSEINIWEKLTSILYDSLRYDWKITRG